MNLIIIIVIVIIAVICFYFINRLMTRNIVLDMKKEDNGKKKLLNKLKTVESDDRMLKLIKSSDTNMTELGMAIDKSSVNIHDLDIKYPGSEGELMIKFKNMTMELIHTTMNISKKTISADLLKQFKSHWRYYALIFDTIFISDCKNNNLEKYKECSDHWKKYYKDKPLAVLRLLHRKIYNNFGTAILYVGSRGYVKYIQDDLANLFKL